MPVNDVQRNVLLGRDAELDRLRGAAQCRRENVKTILVTGARGSGKTALVEAAAEGIGAEVLRLLGTPLGSTRPFETGMNAIATFEQSETFRPIRSEIAAIVNWAYAEQPTPVELARRLVGVMRTLPPKDFPTVVLFEDLHLYDPASLQAVAFFARQNHLYDQTYFMTDLTEHDRPDFQGLETLRLGPLPLDAAQACLSHWSELAVPRSVAATLNKWSDGVPLILRELAATLDEDQLGGDWPLPIPPELTPNVRECLAPILDAALPAGELEALAAFSHQPVLPTQVARAVMPAETQASLTRRHLLGVDQRSVRIHSSALAWGAWNELSPQAEASVAGRLADGWLTSSPTRSAYFRTLAGPMTDELLSELRRVLVTAANAPADLALVEHLAEVRCTATPTRVQSADAVRWLEAALGAGHLGSATQAFQAAAGAAESDDDSALAIVRYRGIVADLTGEPGLALLTPRDVTVMGGWPAGRAFTAWVIAARGAVRAGALEQGRRYLTNAHALRQSADVAGRALWQLADCEWHVLARRLARPEVMVEAVTRWCDHGGADHWYDAGQAATALVDLGAYEAAEQLLLRVDATHVAAQGIGRVYLLASRLHAEVATFNVDAAEQTAIQITRLTLSPRLALPTLDADLVRLTSLTGRRSLVRSVTRATRGRDSRVEAAEAYEALVNAEFARAALLFQAAFARRPPLADGWELLADLVEARLAAGEAPATVIAAGVAAAAQLPEPRSGAADAAAARVRGLLAGPLDFRDAFTDALDVADRQLPLIYRARALLAFALKSQQTGSGEAAHLRREAAELFAHLRLPGWLRHAQQQIQGPQSAVSQPYDQLDHTEQQVVRLLAAGRRNRELAAELYVSLRTVEKVLTRVYRKFGVTSKTELLAKLNSP